MRVSLILIGFLVFATNLWAQSSLDLVTRDLKTFPAQKIIDQVVHQQKWASLSSENSIYEVLDFEDAFLKRIERVFSSLPVKYRRDFAVRLAKFENIAVDSDRHLILVSAGLMQELIDGRSESDADLVILVILAHELAHYYYNLSKENALLAMSPYPPNIAGLARENMAHARVEMIACTLLMDSALGPRNIESGFRHAHRFISDLYEKLLTEGKRDESGDIAVRRKAVEICLSEN